MLKNIISSALKIKMLSATNQCYLPHCTATAPVLSATPMLGQNPALK